MTNANYLFCSAKLRPTVCLVDSPNLCCFNCEKNAACTALNKLSNIKPCTSKVISSEEICEFMI
jgi:hypothetical protein